MPALSKSRYVSYRQCPKLLWLNTYAEERPEIDLATLQRMQTGQEVGELAKGLFGDYVDVTVRKDDGHLDLTAMIRGTGKAMADGAPVICEAAFSSGDLYCAVDLLKKEDDGWAIYAVKRTTQNDKNVYMIAIAYQRYVLEQCGVNVTGTYLVTINNEYIFDGTLDLSGFFNITDVSDEILEEYYAVPANCEAALAVLAMKEELHADLSKNCHDPYDCLFWTYCTKELPSPSVFDLYHLNFSTKIDLYRAGKISFEDLKGDPIVRDARQKRQIEHTLYDKEAFTDPEHIKEFLDQLTYPLYFLDFETMQLAVPQFVGTKPYAQIPFQYSLHYIEYEGGPLLHKEFLAESDTDPLRAIAERLCEDIPMDACVTAYYKPFECTRLKELAGLFPDFADHLLNIRDHVIDLLVPFQSGWYYNRAMGGSFSIKSVLPALFPDDPALDYHNLEDIHNGAEAMTIFPQIQYMPPDEQERTRRNLLKYCELDTYAMVKLWEELRRVAVQ